MNQYNNEELNLVLRMLDGALKEIETPMIRELNIPVYQSMLRATAILELFAGDVPGCGKVEVIIKPKRLLGKVLLEIPSLEVLPLRLIREIADSADDCAVYESSGGRQRFCVTFHRLFLC